MVGVLLLDEGSTATPDKAEGGRWGTSTYPARSISILCRDAEVPRCWSLGIACERAPSERGCESPRTRLSGGADALLDCYNEKGLQMQAFLEAAEGIRTLDLLHGKRHVGEGNTHTIPAQRHLSRERGVAVVQEFATISGDLGT